MTTISADIDIDADDLIEDAHSKVYEIAEEAIAEYDLTDQVDTALEASLNDRIADDIGEHLMRNPAELIAALAKAFNWANERRALIVDQAKELEAKRRRIVELERELLELRQPTTPESEETDASGTRPEMS